MIQRKTIQCDLVLKAVQKLQSHATADEIYAEVAREHPSVGRGTVYRNLQRLTEAGQIRKVEVPDGADRYDHCCKAHYHVRCERCGRVFDVDMPYMTALEKSIGDRKGFLFTGHSIMFSGICPQCRAIAGQESDAGRRTAAEDAARAPGSSGRDKKNDRRESDEEYHKT